MSITAPAQQNTRTAVRLQEVTRSYPDGDRRVHALAGISLALAPGSFTAIMGPSGSGKSTLLNCAAGLERIESGVVWIGEVELSALRPAALTRFRRDRIGFVFQAYNLIDHLSVMENIGLPLQLAGTAPDRDWERHLITAVGLEGLGDRLPGELSGGQAQRVALARALVTRPEVVFADEPTGALDSRTGEQVMELIRSTAAQLHQTVVMVTHDARVAASAEQVLFLADGRLAGHLQRPGIEQIQARLQELGR